MMTKTPFRDRYDAGRILAARLGAYAGKDAVVLGLPRGGVPVAHEVASALNAPLDVFVVRKLGVPDFPELAMGAVASGGAAVLNDDVVRTYRIDAGTIEQVTAAEKREVERRERDYRQGRPTQPVENRTVIIVDDGLATGASMRAAVTALRRLNPRRIVVAVPVASSDACREIGDIADEVVCAETPAFFQAVGQWYSDFSQTSDDEVRRLLQATAGGEPEQGAGS